MKKPDRKNVRRTKRRGPASTIVKWTAGLAVAGLIVYGLSQTSPGVAYDEQDIAVVDFTRLDDDQRLDALQQANRERCGCGCGMGLAQCVATDMTCPIRERNIERIRTMVRQAQ